MARKSRYNKQQRELAVRAIENGIPMSEVSAIFAVSTQTLYRWRAKFVGLSSIARRRWKGLERENRILRDLLAEAGVDEVSTRSRLSLLPLPESGTKPSRSR